MRHDAEIPPTPRGDEDQDVNPAESPARTGNPYIITNGLSDLSDRIEETTDEMERHPNEIESVCTNYIEYVKNYKDGHTAIPVYNQASRHIFNKKAQREATPFTWGQ